MSSPPSPEELLLPGSKPIGTEGRNSSIRRVAGGREAAEDLFHDLTRNGTFVDSSGYPGISFELPGRGRVGFRPASKSGEPTIDVDIPGIPIRKIKFV